MSEILYNPIFRWPLLLALSLAIISTMGAATLQTQGGKSVQGYRVEVDPNIAGVFKARAKLAVGAMPLEGETHFVVTKPVTELTGKPIDRELLKKIAETNRRKFYELEKWNDWPKDLHVEETHFSLVLLTDLWNSPLLLAFLMSMLCVEWIARKRWNLPQVVSNYLPSKRSFDHPRVPTRRVGTSQNG